jgi:acyl-CoA thioesterase II
VDAPAANSLERAIARAHDQLLHALDFEALGGDRFRAGSEAGRFDRIFGGQLLAQALRAASVTASDLAAGSLHATFVGAGAPDAPLDLTVERVRDGRSISTRRVEVAQGGRPLLVGLVSFHVDARGPDLAPAPHAAPGPEQVPRLQDWVADAPSADGVHSHMWIDRPPACELRIPEPPNFLGGPAGGGPRAHWMRLPPGVTADPTLHPALLAYASDYFLLDMAFRSYPAAVPAADLLGTSLDHAIWFHRPVNFDEWHLHTQETLAFSGERGLVRGSIHDAAGHLVASVAQAVLVRVRR